MPRPHRRIVVSDDEEDDDIVLQENSIVEEQNNDITSIPTIPRKQKIWHRMGEKSRRSNDSFTTSSSNPPSDTPSTPTSHSSPSFDSISPSENQEKQQDINNHDVSFMSTPNALSTPINYTKTDAGNSHGIQVAHLHPLSQNQQILNQSDEKQDSTITTTVTPSKSFSQTTAKPNNSSRPNAIPRLGTPPSLTLRDANIPNLGPPRTPERSLVSFEADFNKRLHLSGKENISTDLDPNSSSHDIANLITISPSKGRLRALEAEKAASQADKQKDPRLVITKLVLTNFKSYAGKQEIGPFDSVSIF